jgi:glycosyltransferase involved in cell wall biosynthesis
MNILYHFRTRGTGPEAVHISGIATAFEKLGHHVVFSSPTGVDPRKTAGANPYKAAGKAGILTTLSRSCPGVVFELLELGYNLAAYWRNRKILKTAKFDLIYERHALFLASTALLARRHNIPLVVEVNELVGDARVRKQPWLSFLARRLDKILFQQAAVIVVVSHHLKRRIESLGISGDKILVLPNAVDDQEYAQVADGSAMRERWGLSAVHEISQTSSKVDRDLRARSDAARRSASTSGCLDDMVVIGFVGWFVPWHRLDLLLNAFATLAATRPFLRLVLIGEGPLKAELQAQIKRLGIETLVIFPGALPHHEIPAAIAAMDICVVPHSNDYRSPIKLFEYMGQGRLVVAPATEPIEMVVRHGENGLLFKAEDKASLLEALTQGVDDPAFRNKVGQQARSDVLAHHTWRENAVEVLKWLDVGSGK